MKVYISGPMTGIPDFNYPAFNFAAKCLRCEGLEVVNPVEVQISKPSPEWADYLKADIRELVTCDEMRTLEGWEKSRGACLEVDIARRLGIPIRKFKPVITDALVESLR